MSSIQNSLKKIMTTCVITGTVLGNCKVILKLKWTRHRVLASNCNSNNIIFSIKDTKYCAF